MPYGHIGAGTYTSAGAPTSGVLQKETATVVGTVTLTGNAKVTITCVGLTGSPLDVAVPVINLDNAAAVAGKMRTVLAADPVVGAFFTVGGTGADVSLEKTGASALNDSTFNIAYDNDTCTGLTPDATSAHTTAGVLGFWHGALNGEFCLDTTNHAIYINTGDETFPVWTLV